MEMNPNIEKGKEIGILNWDSNAQSPISGSVAWISFSSMATGDAICVQNQKTDPKDLWLKRFMLKKEKKKNTKRQALNEINK